MIDIKTCSAREVFDYVKHHLLMQGEPCIGADNDFAYRSELLSDPGGCLLSDEQYSPLMEGKTWSLLAKDGWVPSEHKELINNLQIIHDVHEVEDWEEKLNELEKTL